MASRGRLGWFHEKGSDCMKAPVGFITSGNSLLVGFMIFITSFKSSSNSKMFILWITVPLFKVKQMLKQGKYFRAWLPCDSQVGTTACHRVQSASFPHQICRPNMITSGSNSQNGDRHNACFRLKYLSKDRECRRSVCSDIQTSFRHCQDVWCTLELRSHSSESERIVTKPDLTRPESGQQFWFTVFLESHKKQFALGFILITGSQVDDRQDTLYIANWLATLLGCEHKRSAGFTPVTLF